MLRLHLAMSSTFEEKGLHFVHTPVSRSATRLKSPSSTNVTSDGTCSTYVIRLSSCRMLSVEGLCVLSFSAEDDSYMP